MTHAAIYLPCPCCATPMAVRWTQKDKPYFHCDDCGVQLFIRRQRGIKLLMEKHGGRKPQEWQWG